MKTNMLSICFPLASLMMVIGCSGSNVDNPPRAPVPPPKTVKESSSASTLLATTLKPDQGPTTETAARQQQANAQGQPQLYADANPTPAEQRRQTQIDKGTIVPAIPIHAGALPPDAQVGSTHALETPRRVPIDKYMNNRTELTTPKDVLPVQAASNMDAGDYEIIVPQTDLGDLFNHYMNDKVDLDGVESMAGQIVASVFEEDDQIVPKRWELKQRAIARKMSGETAPTDEDRLRTLDDQFQRAIDHRKWVGYETDAAYLIGSTAAFSVLSGYNAVPTLRGVRTTVSSMAQGAVSGARAGLEGLQNGAARIFNVRNARQTGQKVEAYFSRMDWRSAPEGALIRDLEALGVANPDIEVLAARLLPMDEVDAANLSTVRFYPTGLPTLRVAAITEKTPVIEAAQVGAEGVEQTTASEARGYLVMKRRSGSFWPFGDRSPKYFRTASLPKAEIERIMDSLLAGQKSNKFLRLVRGDGTVDSTRLPFDSFTTTMGKIKQEGVGLRQRVADGYRSVANRVTGNFNAARAGRTFLYGAVATPVLVGTGYAIRTYEDTYDADVYLEALTAKPKLMTDEQK